jgi:catechol 2,3-dioxygenase-like lactoylglutathione lyase family enzyme
MDEFYRSVLDLKPEPTLKANRIGTADYPGHVAFLTDGAAQFHLSDQDLFVGFRRGQMINPLERGHVAFRTDDIEAVKRRLKEKGIPFSDYGAWAMNGWYQIFFYDPAGNVVEVHQDQS